VAVYGLQFDARIVAIVAFRKYIHITLCIY